MKKTIALILSIVIVFASLSACRDIRKYYEDEPEYFTIAVYSLLGINGHESDTIELLEIDSQGRVLFRYEGYATAINATDEMYSILICQKKDSEYVYFYPDYNFIVRQTTEIITDEEIAQLKQLNDWNEPLDETKMIQIKITRIKQSDSMVKRFEKDILENWVDFESEFAVMSGLGKDENERWLYYILVRKKNDSRDALRSYILILNSDYTYEDTGIEQVDDIWNYQEQLKIFKEENNWNIYSE